MNASLASSLAHALRPAQKHTAVAAYEALMKKELKDLLKCCSSVGEPVASFGKAMEDAVLTQRDMIAKAVRMRRPSATDEMRALLKPTEAALARLEDLKTTGSESNPGSHNHLHMLCGACSALGWVTSADPKGYISDALNAVPVFGSKILAAETQDAREGRGAGGGDGGEGEGEAETLIGSGEALIRSLKHLLRRLKDYVEQHHPAGLIPKP
jgi:hypothetical protein